MANNTEKQYLETTPMKGRVYRPLIKVSFHTETGLYHANSNTRNKYGEKLDPNNEVLSVNTSKTLSSPAGTFTMSLAGTQWSSRVKPQDVTVIQMGYAGEAQMCTIMVGLVDRVQRKRTMGGDGKPSITTSVTGRDFGKLFVKEQLKFYPEISGKKASDFFLTDVGWVNLMKVFTADSIVKGSPAVIIENVMKYIFPRLNGVSWTLWNEKATATTAKREVDAEQIVRYVLGKMNFFMPFIFSADQYEGALWNLIDRASPKPFTELFIDTRNPDEVWHDSADKRLVPHEVEKSSMATSGFSFGSDGAQVVLCFRQTPYDSVHKNRVIRHTINQEDVIDEDLYVSDDQHYNLFWAGTTINPLGIDLKRVAPPLMNEANVKKYGLSPLEVSVEGMEVTDGLALEGMSKTYTQTLKAWFENNHELFEGNIEIRGRGVIRIGHMISYICADFSKEFYVEDVSQSFSVYSGWTTTLQVTRGMTIATPVDSTKGAWEAPKAKPKDSKKTNLMKSYFYTVRKGDTLWSIAKAEYGETERWRKIWDANATMLTKRDKRNAKANGLYIYPGQKLVIPA